MKNEPLKGKIITKIEYAPCEICKRSFPILIPIEVNANGEYPPSTCGCEKCEELLTELCLCETEDEVREVSKKIKQHIDECRYVREKYNRLKFFLVSDVKSAIEGLLEDIEEEIAVWQKAENTGKVNKAYAEGRISCLVRMRDWIEKWFADVFKNE